MKDIRSLYLAARNTGSDDDIKSYTESINELAENRPYDYLPHLEYIISSSIGVDTFLPFVEKYGFPIAAYDDTMACFEKCREKCKKKGYDETEYAECIAWLESYRKHHIHAFAMYEFYAENDPSAYVSTYYKSTNGHQNRLLAAGMIKKFGECAIPDATITASNAGDKATSALMEYVYENHTDQVLSEWMVDIIPESMPGSNAYLVMFSERTATNVVESVHSRVHAAFREALIMDKPQEVVEYTENEIESIRNLITFKEYQLLWMDEFDTPYAESQNEIYSLYEELDSAITEDSNTSKGSKSNLVPVYAILKKYSNSKLRNDGSEKSEEELSSVEFNQRVKFLTRGDNYSHALISFDPSFNTMYSFDDQGFVKDSIEDNISWLGTESIYVTVLFVTKDERSRMKEFCNKLSKTKTEYAYGNILKQYAGKPTKTDNRFICSTFTGYILQLADPKNLHRDYSRFRPEDVTIIPRAFYITNFKDRDDFIKRKKELVTKTKAIFVKYKDEIEDYNNNLPRIILKDQMTKLKTFDKIFDWIMKML